MKKPEEFLTHFVNQPHKLLIELDKLDPLYEKAFFTPDREEDSEYTRNTTTWD